MEIQAGGLKNVPILYRRGVWISSGITQDKENQVKRDNFQLGRRDKIYAKIFGRYCPIKEAHEIYTALQIPVGFAMFASKPFSGHTELECPAGRTPRKIG